MSDRISTPSLLALLLACPVAAQAGSVPQEPEYDTCRKASCFAANQDDSNAGYIFGKPAEAVETQGHRDDIPDRGHDLIGDKLADREHDRKFGPIEIPPRGQPDLIHTGSGKDIVPGSPAAAPIIPTPTAVPVPAAAWLLISGIAGLGLGAWRRRT